MANVPEPVLLGLAEHPGVVVIARHRSQHLPATDDGDAWARRTGAVPLGEHLVSSGRVSSVRSVPPPNTSAIQREGAFRSSSLRHTGLPVAVEDVQ